MGLFDGFFSGGSCGPTPLGTSVLVEDQIKELAKKLGIPVTDADVIKLMAGVASVMDTANQGKWHKLIEERSEVTKQLKLDEFKKLPASMRQYIIDSILWTRGVQHINELEAPKLQEERNLETLHGNHEALSETVYDLMRGKNNIGLGMGMGPSMLAMMRNAHAGAFQQRAILDVKGPCHYADININENIIKLQQLIDAHSEQCIADGISGDLNK